MALLFIHSNFLKGKGKGEKRWGFFFNFSGFYFIYKYLSFSRSTLMIHYLSLKIIGLKFFDNLKCCLNPIIRVVCNYFFYSNPKSRRIYYRKKLFIKIFFSILTYFLFLKDLIKQVSKNGSCFSLKEKKCIKLKMFIFLVEKNHKNY